MYNGNPWVFSQAGESMARKKNDEPITKSVSHATYENVMAIKYMGIYPTGVTYENVMAKLVHPTGVLGISSTTVDGDGTRLMWLQST